jgi:D-alanine-D-alanine ligase
MAKLRVAVLMGGASTEREVSLSSGTMIVKNLDPTKYEAFPVEFSDLLGSPARVAELKAQADFVFLALHGGLGEDGTVQGLLDAIGLPYQGSGVLASALAMNKTRAKSVYGDMGIPQARGLDFKRLPNGEWQRGVSPLHPAGVETYLPEAISALVGETLGWNLILKGANQGSTIGLTLVKDPAEFWAGMARILAFDAEVLVEERLPGLECTAGVIGGARLRALPLIEIIPKTGDLFDYAAKYTTGGSDEICPARLAPELTAEIQALARLAHRGLGCWGYSRSDFMIVEGQPYILETNTLPGMTEHSLIPKAARQDGLMMPELLDQLIGWGLERAAAAPAAASHPEAVG